MRVTGLRGPIVWTDGRVWVPVWPVEAQFGFYAIGWIVGQTAATMRSN